MEDGYVYICCENNGYEGHSLPKAVFSTHREACVFREGNKVSCCGNIEIYKMKIDQLVDEPVKV